MKKISFVVFFLVVYNSLLAQQDGVYVVETYNQKYSRNFNLEIPVIRDTILCHDSMVIYQNGSFINLESEIPGQTKDTSFYAPVRYIFLDLKKKQGQEYCTLSEEAFPYCRFNFETRDSLFTPFHLFYGSGGFGTNFQHYEVLPPENIGKDIFQKVIVYYSNIKEKYIYTYTLKKQDQR